MSNLESSKGVRVSVIVPCRNEERFISKCLMALLSQTYPAELLEIIVVDGMSTDRTRQMIREIDSDRRVQLIDNPRLVAPAALNLGIQRSSGAVIQIVGAHAVLDLDYVRIMVDVLASQQEADCVGGTLTTLLGTGGTGAIALAMASPFGVGNAKFRYSTKAEYVDTVAFGAYRREVFSRIGGFDESLPQNDDDEFNYRLRREGGRILLWPELRSTYFGRSSLRALWLQYFRYGSGKVKVALRHARMMQPRQLAPGAFVLTLLALSVLTLANGPWFGALLILSLCVYGAVVFGVSAALSIRFGWRHFVRLMLAFIVLHFSYGLGSLWGTLRAVFERLRGTQGQDSYRALGTHQESALR